VHQKLPQGFQLGPVDDAIVSQELVQVLPKIGSGRGVRRTEIGKEDGAFGHANALVGKNRVKSNGRSDPRGGPAARLRSPGGSNGGVGHRNWTRDESIELSHGEARRIRGSGSGSGGIATRNTKMPCGAGELSQRFRRADGVGCGRGHFLCSLWPIGLRFDGCFRVFRGHNSGRFRFRPSGRLSSVEAHPP
jgi:hypothetical protein